MTKVIILGQEPKEEKKLKPIQFTGFIHYLGHRLCDSTAESMKDPSFFDEIRVIKREGNLEFDIFLCYKDGIRSTYIGNLNDGVVE